MELSLGIRLINPPKQVGFCLQKGKDEKVGYCVADSEDILFSFVVRVRPDKEGAPNFLGEFTQGRPKERFVYICVGQYAGQEDTEWARRVKIYLSGISWEQIEQVSAGNGKLVASYQATDKDGGPSCASVPLIGDGWVIE